MSVSRLFSAKREMRESGETDRSALDAHGRTKRIDILSVSAF